MRCVVVFAILVNSIGLAAATQASEQYLYVPSIADSTSVPGYTGAMKLGSSLIAPDGYTASRLLDTASPEIQLAVTGGTPLGTTSLLLYNSTPTGAPDAILSFKNTLASNYTLTGGTPIGEQDSFSTSTPASIYLQVPGITGPASTPGFTGLMPVQNVGFASGSFSVLKDVDGASPDLQNDLTLGTLLPTATLLFYDTAPAGAQPDAEVVLHNVMVSSDQLTGANNLQQEVGFAFQSLSQPTPEPQTLGLVALALATTAVRRRRPY